MPTFCNGHLQCAVPRVSGPSRNHAELTLCGTRRGYIFLITLSGREGETGGPCSRCIKPPAKVQDLINLVQTCEDDTRRLLGDLAAQRLGNWRRHIESERSLIEYIEQLLWVSTVRNGKRLDQQDGLSLQRIVLDHKPELFTESDRQQAKRTLGIA